MDTPVQSIRLFDPARLPEPDGLGWVEHPDLPRFYSVPATDDENAIDLAKLREAGFTHAWVDFESDASDDLQEAYDGTPSAVIRDWQPTPPAPECLLAGIWDAEDGPIAFYVRELVNA